MAPGDGRMLNLDDIKHMLVKVGLYKEGKVIECFPCQETWGRKIHFLDDDDTRIFGWRTPLPEVGDELRFMTVKRAIARFRITKMEPCGNPRDMFFADVECLGYLEGS